MKENKLVLVIIIVVLVAAGWYVYPLLFPDYADHTQVKANEYEQALRLMKEGKPEDARKLLEQGLAKEPEEGKYHFVLGNIARQQNNMDEALSQYDETIQKSPNIIEAYNNKTAVLMLYNKMDEALTTAEAGLKQDPGFKDLQFKKGQLLYVKKEFAQALAVLQPLSSEPEYVEAFRFAGLSLAQQQQYVAAVEQLKLYLQKTPQDTKGRTDIEKMIADIETRRISQN